MAIILDFLKLFAGWINSPKTMFVFGVVAGIPLFIPACWLDALHLSDAVDHYRPFLWLVFSICAMGLIFDGGKAIVNRARFTYRLRHLSRDEQEFLSYFVHDQVSTRSFLPHEAKAASSLEADGILFMPTTLGQLALEDKTVCYTIKPPWILRYLQKHSHCLGGFATRQIVRENEED